MLWDLNNDFLGLIVNFLGFLVFWDWIFFFGGRIEYSCRILLECVVF